MKGVLYISFLVCILLGCSDSDGLPDGGKDKTARTELEIVSASIVEGNTQTRAEVPFTPRKFHCFVLPRAGSRNELYACE